MVQGAGLSLFLPSVGREIFRHDGLERLRLDTKITKQRLGATDHLVRSQQPDLITGERTGKHLQQPA